MPFWRSSRRPRAAEFGAFWRTRYARALEVEPNPRLRISGETHPRFRVHDLEYNSTEGFPIRGWLLTPRVGSPRRGFVLGHGYGGIEVPPYDLPRDDGVYLVPCFRGLGRSQRPPISADPEWHVLHDIDSRDNHILGGCVDDVWVGVSTLLLLFPELVGHVGYLGISFGGGIGAMAMAWDARIASTYPVSVTSPCGLLCPASAARLPCDAAPAPKVESAIPLPTTTRRLARGRSVNRCMLPPPASIRPSRRPGNLRSTTPSPETSGCSCSTQDISTIPGRARQTHDLLAELWAFFAPL